MKVTNWCKSLRVTLLAAGVWAPGAVCAQNIPVPDAGFETYTIPPRGYAYAANPLGAYRPTSAWVDDLDSPPGYTQDNNISNWIYTATYAESATFSKRPTPRSGTRAMHGLFNYNAQELGAVFEADKAYTFSIWAQNDVLLNDTNGVFLYLFDGNVPFSDDNSLSKRLFTDINQRGSTMTPLQSQANWTEIKISHAVPAGAPEIGHPIGVGFFARRDSAVDDAALRKDPIEDVFMFLEVDTTNGQVVMKNLTGEPINIDYYEITSALGSLNKPGWESINEQQDVPGFPPGDGSGNGWEEFGFTDSTVVGESNPSDNSPVLDNVPIGLGAAYALGDPHDLVFQYSVVAGDSGPLLGDYNFDDVVDAADYVVWRKTNINGPQGYSDWRANFGATGGPSGPGTLVKGFVRYLPPGAGSGGAVPEPSTVLLVGIGLTTLACSGRRRVADD